MFAGSQRVLSYKASDLFKIDACLAYSEDLREVIACIVDKVNSHAPSTDLNKFKSLV